MINPDYGGIAELPVDPFDFAYLVSQNKGKGMIAVEIKFYSDLVLFSWL